MYSSRLAWPGKRRFQSYVGRIMLWPSRNRRPRTPPAWWVRRWGPGGFYELAPVGEHVVQHAALTIRGRKSCRISHW